MEISSNLNKSIFRYIKRLLLWLKKWDKLIAVLVTFFIFFIILLIVIIQSYRDYFITSAESEVTSTTVPKAKNTIPELDTFAEVDSNSCVWEDQTRCSIKCSNINEIDVTSEINKLNFSVSIDNTHLI